MNTVSKHHPTETQCQKSDLEKASSGVSEAFRVVIKIVKIVFNQP